MPQHSKLRTVFAAIVGAAALAVPTVALASNGGPGPSQCSGYFGKNDPRSRIIKQSVSYPGAELHARSEKCSPYGAYRGTVAPGAKVTLYWADKAQSSWCYVYAPSIDWFGYVLCSDIGTP